MSNETTTTNNCTCGSVVSNEDTTTIRILTHPHGNWIRELAQEFEIKKNNLVKIEIIEVPSFFDLSNEIINEAQFKAGLYHAFFTPPQVTGSVVQYKGWKDLTDFIRQSSAADWSDILIGYKKYIAQYEGKILMFPFDGDSLQLYYRDDVLRHLNLQPPRTWQEYAVIANKTNGTVFDGQEMYGSCVGRMRNCAGAYWTNLLLASITQTSGPSQGHLFSTSDMKPLTGSALCKTIRLLEEQVYYGPPDEFERCVDVNINYMNEGKCVLTYNWGNSFKEHLNNDSVIRGKMGVTRTPGSTHVLDRGTMKLVKCDKQICPNGKYFDDIGVVNYSPYLAFGGWSLAISNHADEEIASIAMQFGAWASSMEVSTWGVIPNVSSPIKNGQDPFRRSHLDLDLYLQRGYDREAARDFIKTVEATVDSDAVAVDIRFPSSYEIYDVLDKDVHDYLNMTKHRVFANEADRSNSRKQLVQKITAQLKSIIKNYDTQQSTSVPTLEIYQRLRNVYTPDENLNQIGNIRIFGIVLASIVMICCIGFGVWSITCRRSRVVRASQPMFLVMICVGVFILSSSIIPLGVDDGVADEEGCSKACMAIPWLTTTGFVIAFSALFSKIQRLNIIHRNTAQFKRVKVSEKDVLLPFAILMIINTALLLMLSLIDPYQWERVTIDKRNSYGRCQASGSGTATAVLIGLIATVNVSAVILANVAAWRARHISTEYSESRYVTIIMGSLFQIFIVGVPLVFLVDGNPSATYFLLTSMIFIICTSILLLIFVPKVVAQITDEKRKNNSSGSQSQKGLKITSTRQMNAAALERTKNVLVEEREKFARLIQLLDEKGIDADALLKDSGLPSGEQNAYTSQTEEGAFVPTVVLESEEE